MISTPVEGFPSLSVALSIYLIVRSFSCQVNILRDRYCPYSPPYLNVEYSQTDRAQNEPHCFKVPEVLYNAVRKIGLVNICLLDMSGKRLLDAITFLKVSSAIAGKHVALRRRQLDIHSRTSSLTKGIKAQADRIALALQAASELARRFDNSTHSTYTNQRSEVTTPEKVNVEGKSEAWNC